MNTKYFMFCLVSFMSFVNIHPFLSIQTCNSFQKKLGQEQFRASNEVLQVQKPGSVMVWGCVSALGKGNLHFCDGTINAEKYIEILEHNMLPSRRHLFQGRPCIFQQDNAKPHSAHITKSWLRRKRVQVLDWPACSPDLSPIENVWRILKRKMRQRRPRTVAHLKTCLQEEWDKITPETLHHLVSSVPKRLLSVVKRNGNITKW